jgi:N utilization substance protein B
MSSKLVHKEIEEVVDETEQEIESEDLKQFSYDDLSRREVRSLIFHLLYAAESFDYQESLAAIVDNFNRGFELTIPMQSEVVKTAREIIDKRDELDELYKPLLTNWRFERVGVCTKLILRFAVWEIYFTKTDARIIINEAVELTKCFAETDAYRFVNGILDKVAKAARGENVVTDIPSES